MPFFQDAKGDITMNNCSVTDVAGDMHHYDYRSHIGNRGPSYVRHMTDSHSTPSTSMGGERMYCNYCGVMTWLTHIIFLLSGTELDIAGQIIGGLVYTAVHGKRVQHS